MFQDQGHLEEAGPLYRRVLAIREVVPGPNHPDTANTLNDLAGLLRAQGHFKEAGPLYRRVLAIRERVPGPDHPHTAHSLVKLAQLLRFQGHFKQAERLLRRALRSASGCWALTTPTRPSASSTGGIAPGPRPS